MRSLKSASCAALGARLRSSPGARPVLSDPIHDGVGEHQFQRGDPFNEVPHVVVDRVGDDLFGRADLHDPAVIHDRDTAADTDRLVQIVRDEDRGLVQFGRERQELLLKPAPNQRIQRGERLIHQQDLGVRRERPGEPDPLLHAPRQLAGEAVLVTVEIDETEAALGRPPNASISAGSAPAAGTRRCPGPFGVETAPCAGTPCRSGRRAASSTRPR